MSHKRGQIVEALRSLVHALARAPITGKVLNSLSKERTTAYVMGLESTLRANGIDHVVKGPFKGLKYPPIGHLGYTALVYKFLGVFEMELHGVLEQILRRNYTTVLNIGAADGYYTAGFAKFLPSPNVIAWEMDPFMRNLLVQVLDANGVRSRVELREFCTVSELRSVHASGHTLVFSDCEGGEVELLTKENLAGLPSYDVLVECHDLFVPGATQTLIERFRDTHEIVEIQTALRTLSDVPTELVTLLGGPSDDLYHAIEEPRLYRMSWLFMTDKRQNSHA